MRIFNRTTPYFAFAATIFMIVVAWLFVTRLPLPNEPARSLDLFAVSNYTNWDELVPGNEIFNGSFITYGGTSSHNMHIPRDLVVFLPSLGREAGDFLELSREIESQGHSTDIVDFPSLKRKKDPKDLEEYSRLFMPIILSGDEKVTLVGHAFGNRVARQIASLDPDRISAVILLAAGGQVTMDPKAEQALRDIFNPMKSHKARMEDVE